MREKSLAMAYEHGRLIWAFRVIISKSGVVDEVLLVRIYKSHHLEVNLGDGKVIKYFIVERGNNGRGHRPVVDMPYFEKLMAIDGFPNSHGNLVGTIFENVFCLGFVVGVENKRLADMMPLNDHLRALVEVAEAHNLNFGPTKKVLRNIYRLGVWCGERRKKY